MQVWNTNLAADKLRLFGLLKKNKGNTYEFSHGCCLLDYWWCGEMKIDEGSASYRVRSLKKDIAKLFLLYDREKKM